MLFSVKTYSHLKILKEKWKEIQSYNEDRCRGVQHIYAAIVKHKSPNSESNIERIQELGWMN